MSSTPQAWLTCCGWAGSRSSRISRYRCKLVGIRASCKLVGIRASCKDQVHGVLAKLGVEVTCADIFGAWGSAWLDELALPQPYAGKVASLRSLTGALSAEIAVLEQVTGELLCS